MWSLTSLRTKPIRSFRKSCLLPPKGFFDSIGQRRKLRLVTSMYALPPRPDLALASRLISPHPTWLATYPRSFSERPVFERRPCGDHCSAAACSTGRTASLAGRNTETTARLAALSMTERRSNPPSATARSPGRSELDTIQLTVTSAEKTLAQMRRRACKPQVRQRGPLAHMRHPA